MSKITIRWMKPRQEILAAIATVKRQYEQYEDGTNSYEEWLNADWEIAQRYIRVGWQGAQPQPGEFAAKLAQVKRRFCADLMRMLQD